MDVLKEKGRELSEESRRDAHQCSKTLEKRGALEIMMPVLLDQTEPHIVMSGRSLFSL